MLEIRMRDSRLLPTNSLSVFDHFVGLALKKLIFFLTFISLFSLILYLIRFNANNKCHFLINGDRKEF